MIKLIYIPVFLVFIPIVFSMIIFMIRSRFVTLLAFVAQLAITILAIMYFSEFRFNYMDTMFTFGGWNPEVGIGFLNDEISMAFVFLTVFIWWMVLIYTFFFNQQHRNFLFFIMFLEGVFLGLIQTNDLFNLFVFIELITVLVTILVAYEKAGNSIRAALYYLLINSTGTLLFLLGIILIYYTFGNINISIIKGMMSDPALSDNITVRLAFVFIFTSISVKSALFPVFTWLPRAHAVAKSGISALLSGLVVKGGLYVMIRVTLMFSPAGYDISSILLIVGLSTALVGVIFAMSQQDIKQILAYHTISQIGIIVVGLSFIYGKGFTGGTLHIVNHALFKILLFMSAGVIARIYGTKKVKNIRGVFKTMPLVSILMIVGMLSITGAPLFNGFISKSLIKYDLEGVSYWLLQLVNIGTATSFVKLSQIFFGPKVELTKKPYIKEVLPMTVLALACIAFGVLYKPLVELFLNVDISTVKNISLAYVIEYIIFLGIGYLIYTFFIKKFHHIVDRIRNVLISFETANILFLTYLCILIVFVVLLP